MEIFVGNYNYYNGITKLELSKNLDIKPSQESKTLDHCSYLNIYNNDYIFSVSETKNSQFGDCGQIYLINQTNLNLVTSLSSFGQNPCYITTSQNNKYMAWVNYDSGNTVLYNIENIYCPFLIKNIKNDINSQPHCCIFHDEKLFSLYCSTNQIVEFNIQSLELKKHRIPNIIRPRHIIHKENNTFYIINENNTFITELLYENGTFNITRSIPLSLNSAFDGSTIKFDANKDFLYASLRQSNKIKIFKVDNNLLQQINEIKTYGNNPRDFDIIDKSIIVANTDSKSISAIKLNNNLEVDYYKSYEFNTTPAFVKIKKH